MINVIKAAALRSGLSGLGEAKGRGVGECSGRWGLAEWVGGEEQRGWLWCLGQSLWPDPAQRGAEEETLPSLEVETL